MLGSILTLLVNGAGYITLALVGSLVLVTLMRRLTRKRLHGTSFAGKRVLITGASSGIGEAFAYELAAMGASLCLTARRQDRLEAVASKCRWLQSEALTKTGGRGAKPDTITVEANVAVEADCKRMCRAAIQQLGGIDLVIANAGRGADNMYFPDLASFDLYHEVMDINYWGVLYTLYHALPNLTENKGAILVVSSTAGKIATPGRTGYSPTKFAVNGFCEALRFETPVPITCACPGYVVTEIHDRMLAASGGKRNLAKFISAEQAAREMLTAVLNGDRELIMFPLAWLVLPLRSVLPAALMDRIIARSSEAAFEHNEHPKKTK